MLDGLSWELLGRVLTLQNYNTRLVVLSTTMLGIASGLVGSFLLLRKRSLMSDALSHATLPGIALAFMVMVAFGGEGKALPGLLAGAVVTGAIGVVMVMLIRNTTRLEDDAAMGIVLSVFFGLGAALLGLVQTMPEGSAAGLKYFIYGKTASMIMQDFLLISGVCALAIVICVVLFKEFTLLCFDMAYGKSQGWPMHALDLVMLGLVIVVTVVGLQAVGLILIIAFLITPASAARFWTHDMKRMSILAGVIGGLSGWLGAAISALFVNMPAGAMIVLVAASVFLFSLIFGTSRGVIQRLLSQYRLRRKVGRQHLLRAAFEIMEHHARQARTAEHGQTPRGPVRVRNRPIRFVELWQHRTWTQRQVIRLIQQAKREDHIESFDGSHVQLSEAGFGEAARVTRNHRLWEMFLILHADIAPSHVDRDADAVEHILGAQMVQKLEKALKEQADTLAVPTSPHVVTQTTTPGGSAVQT